MSSSKKYGLILPGAAKSQQPAFQASRNVFGEDSDSDEGSKKKPALLPPSQNINRQAKLSQEKALMDDPTVYQYDEIYDSMTTQKELKKNNKQDKKPKYIENLLKTANKRKIENERRIERQIQKEREKEGDEFADKEVFVTSAYKKKLEEMRLEEEKEKREEYLESIGDVTKQRDLGGFYRHLYEQKLGSDKKVEDIKHDDAERSQTPDPIEVFKKKELSNTEKHVDKSDATKRNYRKRKSSINTVKDLSEGEIDDSDDDEINRINLTEIHKAKTKKSKETNENIDADSDFSIDESSDEDQSKNQSKRDNEVKGKESLKKHEQLETLKESPQRCDKYTNEKERKAKTTEPEPTKLKIDIWKKRTVGDVFHQALKRYYERKASRGY